MRIAQDLQGTLKHSVITRPNVVNRAIVTCLTYDVPFFPYSVLEDIHAVKPLLACALILGLVVSASGPMSACALASHLVAECASPQAQPECDRMDMGTESVPKVTAPAAPCCVGSQAPLPEAKNELSVPTGEPDFATVIVPAAEDLTFETTNLSEVPHDVSPPPLQPLLCTFLI